MMMTNETPPKNKAFENFCLFGYLTNNLGLNLEELVTEYTLEKNDYIYRPSYKQNSIYEIMDGAIKLGSYSDSGEEYVYDVLHRCDFFGNLKYLNNQFFEFSKALIGTRIRAYPLPFFKNVITEHPAAAEWFISYIVKRWCVSEKKLGKIKENNTAKKIGFLRSYLNVKVKDTAGSEFLLYDLLTQRELGDLVGATRQTIANALKKELTES
ncbi:MAG: Crp/Fnr family transcriptional regulator [Pricia sp.]